MQGRQLVQVEARQGHGQQQQHHDGQHDGHDRPRVAQATRDRDGAFLDVLVDARIVGRLGRRDLLGGDGGQVRREEGVAHGRAAAPVDPGMPGTIRRLPRNRCSTFAMGVQPRTRYEARPVMRVASASSASNAAGPSTCPEHDRLGDAQLHHAVGVRGRAPGQSPGLGERGGEWVGIPVRARVVDLHVVHGRRPGRRAFAARRRHGCRPMTGTGRTGAAGPPGRPDRGSRQRSRRPTGPAARGAPGRGRSGRRRRNAPPRPR